MAEFRKSCLWETREYAKLRLPEGRYNAVLFNRSFDDFACIAFRGSDSYRTLEAYASRAESRADELRTVPKRFAPTV